MESKTRTVHELVCEHCGKTFSARRTDAKYCCDACRQQAYLTRSAPRFVERQLPYIEDELRSLETRRGYLTKENIDHIFEEIRELVNHWHYRKLPRDHKLRDYVEGTLVHKVFSLRKQFLASKKY
jgi:hypothetical protein